MKTRHPRLSAVGLVAGVTLGSLLGLAPSDAAARHKKPRMHASSAESTFWNGLVPMENGVPVIMKGYHPHRLSPGQAKPRQRTDRAVKIPRGSSSFVNIPPVNPSPYSSNSPPARALTAPPPQPSKLPPINSYGDRVTNCIHSFPLNGGIGNNPSDQQSYVRQCAN